MKELPILFFSLSAMVSILLLFQRNIKSIRIFIPFLIVRVAAEIYGEYLNKLKIQNIWVNNIIGMLSICFYLYVLFVFIDNKKIKSVILFLSLFFVSAFTVSSVFFLSLNEMHTYELSVGCLMVVAACIYFFYELLNYPNDVKLLSYPPFWIVTGVLFNFAGEMPVYLFLDFVIHQPKVVSKSIFFMVHFLDIILNTLLLIAFLCRLKLRRPSLSY